MRKDGHDVFVVQEGGGLGLDPKALAVARVERCGRRQHFESDAAAKRNLFRLVDDTHAAAADFPDDSVLAERGRQEESSSASSPTDPVASGSPTASCTNSRPAERIGQNVGDRMVDAPGIPRGWAATHRD